jgi:hypothetical protein
MKDAYEVLYQKEADLARVRQEIESLTIVASMLAEDDLGFLDPDRGPDAQNKKRPQKAVSLRSDAGPTETDSRSPIAQRIGFWGSLKRRQR